ncbi:MAG: hypothetical protein DRO67_02040 [Candidatus Asgardarchaeum californiense]|nr:MAG: hypothetical protein DRO67_02040 [Candidatus Asgardarchaeum californiense]
MNRKKSTVLVVSLFLFLCLVLIMYVEKPEKRQKFDIETKFDLETIEKMESQRLQGAIPIVVSEDNPFYAVIATPVALYYDDTKQYVQPLLIQDIKNPSTATSRFKDLYSTSYREIKTDSPEKVSIELSKIWKTCDAALIIENSQIGYEMGIVAAPLASYLNIPIFVTDSIEKIETQLEKLDVKYTFICGNLEAYKKTWRFENIEEINNLLICFINKRFGGIDYVTISNPLDTKDVTVLDKVYFEFEDKTSSTVILPAQVINTLIKGYSKSHTFTVPNYKYACINIDLVNKNSEHVSELGDEVMLIIKDPDGKTWMYTSTQAGLPEIQNGDIVIDRVHSEIIIYNKPGDYTAQVIGKWFSNVEGEYKLEVTIEEIDRPVQPLMNNLSSLSPYLTAYHKGVIFANSSFAFAGDETIGIKGSVYPAGNEELITHCNKHVLDIHERLNNLLAKIAGISPDKLKSLQEDYAENPIHIAILADTTMVPMFYYSDPERSVIKGFGLSSDFIYGNIDPKNGDIENDMFTQYPFMENAVGRIVSCDVEDCSALIARTLFYDEIIEKLGSWKDTATVQTCASIESRNLPVITPVLNAIMGLPEEETTKWPSGETLFLNLKLSENMKKGGYNVKNTFLTASQREGFKDLVKYTKRSQVLFPRFIEMLSGERIVKGGEYQQNSNLIYAMGHGMYYLYESGDLLLDARGFPPISWFSRPFSPKGMRSGLSLHGAYTVRHVENMNFGPSTMFLQSCITGRIDGLLPENCLTQAYLHAGINAIVAPTRHQGIIFTGLKPREFVKTSLNYLVNKEYPDLHFGALIAEDYISNLIDNDATVGMALRNAKNAYLPKDADFSFRLGPLLKAKKETHMDIKNTCHKGFTLYGDPAFNPYQPINNS